MDTRDIDALLEKYLLGEASAEEKTEAEQWLADEGNSEYFREFLAARQQILWAAGIDRIGDGYERFRRNASLRPGRKRRLVQVAAAAVIAVAAAGAGLALWVGRSAVDDTVIPSGSSIATLYLSDGDSVPLGVGHTEYTEDDGTVISVSGTGSVMYGTGGSEGQPPVVNRLVVPRRGEFHLCLADGTQVWLNSESELVYQSHFPDGERRVKLEGEAYFEVARDASKPFVVEAGGMSVRVLGTEFNINTYTSGYVETVLVSGSVAIAGGGAETMIAPGQKALYDRGAGTTAVEDVDITPYVSWKHGNFDFNNEPLEAIMEKLERWYDLRVVYADENARKVRLSGILERYSDVNELFSNFESISDLDFSISGNTVRIGRRK